MDTAASSPATPETMPPFDARYGEPVLYKRLPHTVQHAFSDLVPKRLHRTHLNSAQSLFREVPQTKDHAIWRQVVQAAAELGYDLPKHVYILHANAANAFGDSPTQTIAISQGAVEALDPDALRVLIRHELRHLNQPELAMLEPLEDEAREHYDPAAIPHGTLLPYNRAHSVLMAIQHIEDEAIASEANFGESADDAVRSLLALTRWNVLLPKSTVGEYCGIDYNPYEALYAQLIQPQAEVFFDGAPEAIALAHTATWREFAEKADPFYFCAVVDTMDELL